MIKDLENVQTCFENALKILTNQKCYLQTRITLLFLQLEFSISF